MSYLARLKAATSPHYAGTEALKGSKAPFAPFEGSVPGRVGCDNVGEYRAALARLQSMVPPRITRSEVWPEIVADAVRLLDEGWASAALALGWSPIHLWGCSPDKGGNPDHDGLAVQMCGRRLVLLDETAAILDSGAGGRRLVHRREMPGAILLWELGKAVRNG